MRNHKQQIASVYWKMDGWRINREKKEVEEKEGKRNSGRL
jgi:hypothetical protein